MAGPKSARARDHGAARPSEATEYKAAKKAKVGGEIGR